MNPEPCREMEEWLIDYADGTLPLDESQRIAQHIKQCEGCRKTVDALRESIRVAGTIWQDTLQDIEAGRTPAAKRVHVWGWRYAVAAGVLLAIGGALFWALRNTRAPVPPTLGEMERHIAESAVAARLLAATDALKAQARELDMSHTQYLHILEQYPNTDAAAQVRLKLKSMR